MMGSKLPCSRSSAVLSFLLVPMEPSLPRMAWREAAGAAGVEGGGGACAVPERGGAGAATAEAAAPPGFLPLGLLKGCGGRGPPQQPGLPRSCAARARPDPRPPHAPAASGSTRWARRPAAPTGQAGPAPLRTRSCNTSRPRAAARGGRGPAEGRAAGDAGGGHGGAARKAGGERPCACSTPPCLFNTPLGVGLCRPKCWPIKGQRSAPSSVGSAPQAARLTRPPLPGRSARRRAGSPRGTPSRRCRKS
jgi:hypothetical protein